VAVAVAVAVAVVVAVVVTVVVAVMTAAVASGTGEGEGSAMVRVRAAARVVAVAMAVIGNSDGGGGNTNYLSAFSIFLGEKALSIPIRMKLHFFLSFFCVPLMNAFKSTFLTSTSNVPVTLDVVNRCPLRNCFHCTIFMVKPHLGSN
jgi:hypothetical protein